MSSKRIKLAVIGAGRWGPNLIKNFQLHPDCEVKIICDQDVERLKQLKERYAIATSSDWVEAISDSAIDAVVVCSPTQTHYPIAKKALELKKHVFVEKPLATESKKAWELVELSQSKNLKLMVGHVFLFNPAIQWIKKSLEEKHLGDLYYLYTIRTNLGPIRADVNALWDLAPHDVSILLHLLGKKPTGVRGFGASFINQPIEDVAFANLTFEPNILANIHVSWLDPKKVRQLVIVGSHRMLVFDDMSPQAPIRIFDKNVTEDISESMINDTIHHFRKSIVEGAVSIPDIVQEEPLKNECNAFIDWIVSDKSQPSSGVLGAEVVEVIEKISFGF